MKTILALAATSFLALGASAFAQDAGAPGAVGVTGSATGSNTGTSGWNGYNNGYRPGYGYNNGYGPGYGYGYSNGYNGGYMEEGRAAAPDDVPPPGVPSQPGYYNQGYPQPGMGGGIDNQQ